MQAVETRIEQALSRAGRPRSTLTLVAVSKKFSAAAIREAYHAGVREFGENYVQEFLEKRPQLIDLTGARFHLIGHLQSNKAKVACEIFDVIETADSVRLLHRIDKAGADAGRRLDVLLEIKLSKEENKTGARPEDVPALLQAARTCPHLTILGLMTMPPWSDEPEHSRPYFRRLAQLAREHDLPQLSMGMSNDLEIAIEEGATIIRVGTALFGRRPKPQANISQAVQ